MSKIIAAVALSALLATPAIALAAQQGHRAYAQSPYTSGEGQLMSEARAQALRDCATLEQKWGQAAWGSQQLDVYRECMAQHGQAE